MANWSSSGFSHLRPGVFPIFYKPTKHNIHNWEDGRKEEQTNKQTRTCVSSKRKKGEVFDTCVACIWAKFPQSHQERWIILLRWPTWPLGSQVRAVAFAWSLSSPTSVNCPVLLTALFCRLVSFTDCLFLFGSGTFLPSSSSGVVRNLAGKPFVWVLRQKKKKKTRKSSDWNSPTPTSTETNAQRRAIQI